MRKIIDLRMHGGIVIDDVTDVIRVPGGLVYRFYHENEVDEVILKTSTFVPFTGFSSDD